MINVYQDKFIIKKVLTLQLLYTVVVEAFTFRQGNHADAVHNDFAKAFDKTGHDILETIQGATEFLAHS